ncbi:MAG: ABC transporter permease, partial [Selenomonadaceae bacterium]|nr:ABC transporter permease [Selenomonadaceae bacterium]
CIPLLYTMLFGGLFIQNALTDIPIVICNLDGGSYGRRIVRDLGDTPEVRVVEVNAAPTDLERRMIEMKSFGVVVIPKDFSRQLSTGGSTSIELIIDNTNRSVGSTVSKTLQTVLAPFNAELISTQLQSSARISMSSRILYNPTVGYEDFFLAALIIHGAQIAVVFSVAPSIVDEKLDEKHPITKPLPFLLNQLIRADGRLVDQHRLQFASVIRDADRVRRRRLAFDARQGRGVRLDGSRDDAACDRERVLHGRDDWIDQTC